ncbi:hypothetical protein WDZ92_33740, partial [Nostoc sp. NIES-2111]
MLLFDLGGDHDLPPHLDHPGDKARAEKVTLLVRLGEEHQADAAELAAKLLEGRDHCLPRRPQAAGAMTLAPAPREPAAPGRIDADGRRREAAGVRIIQQDGEAQATALEVVDYLLERHVVLSAGGSDGRLPRVAPRVEVAGGEVDESRHQAALAKKTDPVSAWARSNKYQHAFSLPVNLLPSIHLTRPIATMRR